MKRRGFLRLLGMSPVAGPIAAKEVVSGMSGLAVGVGSDWDTWVGCETPTPPDPALDKLWRSFEDYKTKVSPARKIDVPPQIANKKSWSDAFKRSEARKEYLRYEHKSREIAEVLCKETSTAEKIVRLAAMGVKL